MKLIKKLKMEEFLIKLTQNNNKRLRNSEEYKNSTIDDKIQIIIWNDSKDYRNKISEEYLEIGQDKNTFKISSAVCSIKIFLNAQIKEIMDLVVFMEYEIIENEDIVNTKTVELKLNDSNLSNYQKDSTNVMINLELIDSSVIRNCSHCFLKVK